MIARNPDLAPGGPRLAWTPPRRESALQTAGVQRRRLDGLRSATLLVSETVQYAAAVLAIALASAACPTEPAPVGAAKQQTTPGPPPDPPQVDPCTDYMRANGIFLTDHGPVGPATTRTFTTPEDAARIVAEELSTYCPRSSSAHVHRATLLDLIGSDDEAAAALRTAIDLDAEWGEDDRKIAEQTLVALTGSRSQTRSREAAAHSTDVMAIPGIAADTSISLQVPMPQSGTGQDPWVPFALGLVGGGALVVGLCWSAGCFQPTVVIDNQPTQWVPMPDLTPSAMPPAGPPLGVRDVIRVVKPPGRRDGGAVLKITFYPALDLPPVDDVSISWVPAPPVSSCDEYLSYLIGDFIGLTRVHYKDVRPKGSRFSTSQSTCIRFNGWDRFEYLVNAECIPFLVESSNSTVCKQMQAQFNEACARHEAQHHRDYSAALGAGPRLPSSACIETPSPTAEELSALEATFNKRVSADLDKLTKKAGDALHNTDAGEAMSKSKIRGLCAQCFSDTVKVGGPAVELSVVDQDGTDVLIKGAPRPALVTQGSPPANGRDAPPE